VPLIYKLVTLLENTELYKTPNSAYNGNPGDPKVVAFETGFRETQSR